MAKLEDRQTHNAPGRFYVTTDCIDCDLCRETAPDLFTRSDETGLSIVRLQPKSDEEIVACLEAVEGCPVEAIRRDGEAASA
jgi:ferredoxin